jgi:guanosine-3',5'-bis(diphosphate) 3'-pyrophosphohydrolase
MSVVNVEPIYEIRPRLTPEFDFPRFIPRTPAMEEAYRWGQQLHAGQKRLSGESYFETHCAWVGGFLDRLIGNEAWTIAGLLHDAVEDEGGSLDQIRAQFPGKLGEEVAFIVDGVTKLSNPRDGRSREIETLRKIAIFRDPAVFLVKLADKTHNIMTLHFMPEAKRVQKATEAIRAYGKLAGILNCYRWRRWLEDMAFPHADPETFQIVRQKVDSDPRVQVGFINNTMNNLADLMRVEVIVNGYWQAWQKLRRLAAMRKASLNNFSALNDMLSFRLVVESEQINDCYNLLGAVNRYFGSYLDQDRFDDYIAQPQNGYRALQVTAWLPELGAIEVAITTSDMEGENQWGVVYAIQNKKDISAYRPVEILTPTGGARFVPEGSTVLDAVASIQQEFLLDKISSVEVNGSLARLSDKVQPGDVIEVKTSGQRLVPTEEWLAFCNQSTARLLRSLLAVESLRKSAEYGRQRVRPMLARFGLLAFEDLQALDRDRCDNLLEQLGCSSLQDLYSAVGGEAIRPDDLEDSLGSVGITRDTLDWTTILLTGPGQANRPGVLARLAWLVSENGGNILRVINDILPDGSFAIRFVVKNLDADKRASLLAAYQNCGVELHSIEVV